MNEIKNLGIRIIKVFRHLELSPKTLNICSQFCFMFLQKKEKKKIHEGLTFYFIFYFRCQYGSSLLAFVVNVTVNCCFNVICKNIKNIGEYLLYIKLSKDKNLIIKKT